MNAVYRRLATEIRKIDSRHIIFFEGDDYAKDFSGLEKPFDDNLAYSSHNYTVPGFGPGRYPGTIHPQSAAAGSAQDWDLAKQERNFLDAEGTKFTQQHNAPLWVGEFGSVFNGPANESGDWLRALDGQIGIFESHETHWTTWNYKDLGVMGMLTLNPAQPRRWRKEYGGLQHEARRLLPNARSCLSPAHGVHCRTPHSGLRCFPKRAPMTYTSRRSIM